MKRAKSKRLQGRRIIRALTRALVELGALRIMRERELADLARNAVRRGDR